MQKAEKRKYQRISSIKLLNYVSLDQNYQEVGQGMGRTINMSETGLLIETSTAINPDHFLSLNIGLDHERFKVHGQVVYTSNLKGSSYRTGIRFNQAPKAGYYLFRNLLGSMQKGTKSSESASENECLAFRPPLLKGPECDYLYVADEETYLHGEKITTQGNFGNWAWVIIEGWATVTNETQNGNYDIFKIGPGAFIGSSMSYLMTNHARTNSVVASETVQLGLLDSQRLAAEHATLSPEFKKILESLSGRLKRIIDRLVSIQQGRIFSKEDLLSGQVICKPDQNDFGLHSIVRGKATMLHRNVAGQVPLVTLYPGDFLGSLPFIQHEFEPDFTLVRASTGFQKKELNRGSLAREYEYLSQTLKNMIKFTALKILTGSQLIEQITAENKHIN